MLVGGCRGGGGVGWWSSSVVHSRRRSPLDNVHTAVPPPQRDDVRDVAKTHRDPAKPPLLPPLQHRADFEHHPIHDAGVEFRHAAGGRPERGGPVRRSQDRVAQLAGHGVEVDRRGGVVVVVVVAAAIAIGGGGGGGGLVDAADDGAGCEAVDSDMMAML